MSDLTGFTAEQQALMLRLLEQYQNGTLAQPQGTRSPAPQPLKDLRDPGEQSKRIGRASFFFTQTDSYTTPTEYPKVKWHLNGTDTLVLSRAAEDALGEEWGDTPSGKAQSASERAKAEMMALSPEDQKLVRDAMREARLAKIQAAVSELSAVEIEALMGDDSAKRGPGRPRKTDLG